MAKSVGAWASGSSVGGLDTGLISANTWYAMYAIDGPVAPVDFLMSASYTAPVMPTGYTKKRYIGSIKTDGASHILPFTQNQDCFLWTTPTLDIATATLGVASALFPLNVPHSTTFKVDAIIRGWASNAVAAYLLISSPDTADLAPNTPAGNITAYLALTAGWGELRVRVDASGQVRLRASATSTTVNGLTVGWYDQRGKN